MGQGSVSFPPQELEAIAIYYSQKAMSAEVANARLSLDMQVLLQKLNTANEGLAAMAKQRDALQAEVNALKNPPPVIDPPTPLLPSGGVDDEPAPAAAPKDEVALTGSMGD